MNYWIFKANPDLWDVEKHLKEGYTTTGYKVSRYRNEIKAGDIAFLWITGAHRGIVATLAILSDPYYIPPNPNDSYWSDIYKVDVHLTDHFPLLEAEFLKTLPGLAMLSTFHGFQAGTNFRVTPEEGKIISSIIQSATPK
jgi:predicted RNA-binding protein with PUA-like domain